MSATDKPQKINIGFHGGQVLSARLKDSELTRFREQLGKNGGFLELGTEEGTLVLDLTRVDYVIVATDEHKVGF